MKIAAVAVALVGLVGCVDQTGDVVTSGPDVQGEPAPRDAKTGDWDEARSHGVKPCAPATLDTCHVATAGACEVLEMPWGGECMPVFNWGVRQDGVVEFGSSERLFTIADLADRPLSEGERVEAEELASVIVEDAASGQEPMSPSDGEDPGLIGVWHTGNCAIGKTMCTTTCYGSCVNTYAVYRYHYDSYASGYHIHVFDRYDNYGGTCYRTPYYSGTSSMICGYL